MHPDNTLSPMGEKHLVAETMAEHVSVLLSSRATELSKDIFKDWKKEQLKRSGPGNDMAHEIAIRLHLIGTYLTNLPPYKVEFATEQLCNEVLEHLKNITQPPKESTQPPYFTSLFTKNSRRVDQETCPIYSFKKRIEKAQDLHDACGRLLEKLVGKYHTTGELPEFALQHLDIPSTLDDYDDGIFKALELVAQCEPSSHGTNLEAIPGRLASKVMRHPVRLCLHEPPNNADSPSHSMTILVSAIDMTLWQEFCLNIQPKDTTGEKQGLPLGPGGFCHLLEKDIAARLFLSFDHHENMISFQRNKTQVLTQIFQRGLGKSLSSILSHYHLAPRDKILLSYAIARSYWQHYDSDLMRTQWTSDTIWFMAEDGNSKSEGQLPLCAYLSFPFGMSDNTMPDIMYEDFLNHRCPRIFDIGVLLLEIGLGRPFSRTYRPKAVGQANYNQKLAIDRLLQLQKSEWQGFTDKESFDLTVKFCLNSENFTSPSRQLVPIREGADLATESTAASGWRQGISMRKSILYDNVVRPLEWLAKRGFKAQAGDITYVSQKLLVSLPGEVSDTVTHPESGALFHSSIDPRMWLRDLKKISQYVEHKRRRCEGVAARVRIAILDTGCKGDFMAFQERIGKDFVDPGATTMTDTFGHGTLMARLITECAPGAEIVVVRVAENTEKLGESREKIKEAILWAGQFVEADIISMSFGLPDDDGGIREAIETVHKERRGRVIFLASAGNSSTDDESFPARHPSVISVYATDCHGTFLRSNSASTTNGAAILGRYGDGIPAYITEELSTIYPDVCQPGSSIATAIMAGISATLLIYAGILPSLIPLPVEAASLSLQRIWTTKGMEKVLDRLVQIDPEHARLKAVKPAWFWKDKPSDFNRFIAMADALSGRHQGL